MWYFAEPTNLVNLCSIGSGIVAGIFFVFTKQAAMLSSSSSSTKQAGLLSSSSSSTKQAGLLDSITTASSAGGGGAGSSGLGSSKEEEGGKAPGLSSQKHAQHSS